MKQSIQKIFENIYAENADGLFRFVLYRVSDKEQAIDIVEDTFLRFWQTLQKEAVEQPRALIYRIARHLVIDWYRKKKSVPLQSFKDESSGEAEVFLDMFAGEMVGAETLLEAKLAIEKISSLEPIYREAVYLRFVEELTPKEIAVILGESPNTISVRINRGLRLLKSKLHI
jgi:RNA polymerase sigma-70 factor (ECF subfamily)